jgi:hypothetical protein
MKLANATNINRKSGEAKRRDLRCAPSPNNRLQLFQPLANSWAPVRSTTGKRGGRGGTQLRSVREGVLGERGADDWLFVRSLVLLVPLERYFERELNLAFGLGGAGKQAEVGIRYRVVGLC